MNTGNRPEKPIFRTASAVAIRRAVSLREFENPVRELDTLRDNGRVRYHPQFTVAGRPLLSL